MGRDLSISRSGWFIPGEIALGTQRTRGWVDRKYGLDLLLPGIEPLSCPYRTNNNAN